MKNIRKMNKIQKVKSIYTRQVHVYMLHRLNPLLGKKLGLFSARSTFLLAHASLWPERSGATT